MAAPSSWSYPFPPPATPRRGAPYRSSTASPGMSYYGPQPPMHSQSPPTIPAGLIPGHPQRTQSTGPHMDGLFFMQSPQNYSKSANGSPRPQPTPPSILVPLKRSAEPAAASPPPLPQKPPYLRRVSSASPLPPLPPKPFASVSPTNSAPRLSLYPQAIPGPVAFPQPITIPEEKPPLSSPQKISEDEEFERALRLSAREENQRKNQLHSQEEEEIARALEESMTLDGPPPNFTGPPMASTSSFASTSQRPDSMFDFSSLAPSSHSAPARPHLSSPSREYGSDSFMSLESARSTQTQLLEDEAFARRLAIDDDQTPPTTDHRAQEPEASTSQAPNSLYSDVVNSYTGIYISRFLQTGCIHCSLHCQHQLQISLRGQGEHEVAPLRRVSSADQAFVTTSDLSQTLAPGPRLNPMSASTSAILEDDEEGDSRPAAWNSKTPNQYVEPELLHGISFGFQAPPIGVQPVIMTDPVPNVISLPYGRCPPMHIQAPSWRHLVKLMAKLSATRIEPEIEAMAVTRTDLKLRTVVQFVKVHHSASEWRTVLYLAIDHPVPPGHPHTHKYTNGDVSQLPFSYSLSGLPALLRDGSDGPMAKYYTIPPTASTPLPSLPISLSNMAMYLTSALEDSRKALNDSSSGMRKLAKMVDQFYPDDHATSAVIGGDGSERPGSRSLFGRLVRRGNKSKDHRGGNADRYELVTPFVPDEWG
ncbi:hypothetical protein EWM64_g54 [Hericium alpestre]|uniref:Uncharacterized protein n=1 Tax=Hericium alpestre TaxID=135208 RepID=A0A4Z0ACN4_9AGAM|nr:hypothetical protein EWM64_g54 [Hericium alpestre]